MPAERTHDRSKKNINITPMSPTLIFTIIVFVLLLLLLSLLVSFFVFFLCCRGDVEFRVNHRDVGQDGAAFCVPLPRGSPSTQ